MLLQPAGNLVEIRLRGVESRPQFLSRSWRSGENPLNHVVVVNHFGPHARFSCRALFNKLRHSFAPFTSKQQADLFGSSSKTCGLALVELLPIPSIAQMVQIPAGGKKSFFSCVCHLNKFEIPNWSALQLISFAINIDKWCESANNLIKQKIVTL